MSNAPDDRSKHVPQRASLRGRGWEILRGQSAVSQPGGPPQAVMAGEQEPTPDQDGEKIVMDWVASPEFSKMHSRAVQPGEDQPVDSTVQRPPALMVAEGAMVAEQESIPHIETVQVEYDEVEEQIADVDDLIPVVPEEMVSDEPATAVAAPEVIPVPGTTEEPVPEAPQTLVPDQAVVRMQDVRIDVGHLTPVVASKRLAARDLFAAEKDMLPDEELLEKFVTDERLEALWREIEGMQAELVASVQGDRTLMDTYQKELLQASALLLQDRANYDDVRAILYRVRSDLAREAKVRQDIKTYKPRLLLFIVAAFAVWLILMVLESTFSRFMTEVVGFRSLSLIYHPTLFGMLGAIVNAYFTLNKHTIQLRDFDPAHVSWYMMNPLIGLIMGLLMTLVFGTGIVSTVGIGFIEQVQPEVLGQYPFLLWVFCFLAGYNQNVVLRLLQRTFRLMRGSSDAETGEESVATQEFLAE